MPDRIACTIYDFNKLLGTYLWEYGLNGLGIVRFTPNELLFTGQYALELKGELWTIKANGHYSLESEGSQVVLVVMTADFDAPGIVEKMERVILREQGIILEEGACYAVFAHFDAENRRTTIKMCNTAFKAGEVDKGESPVAWELRSRDSPRPADQDAERQSGDQEAADFPRKLDLALEMDWRFVAL